MGCIALLKAAHAKTSIYYVYRAPPTSSPTSTPSYQPSARPSLQPSDQPSPAPTTSLPPSSLRRNFLTTGATPTSIGFWLTLSLIGILICFVCVGSRRSGKSPCLPCTCGDETEEKVDEDEDGWSAWLTLWSSDKSSKPPRPVAKKKSFLSFFKSSDAEVSPTASSRERKSHKKAKRYEHSDEDSIGQASSFGSFWSSGQPSNPPPPVKKKKMFSSVLKRPDAQVSPTPTRPKERTSRRTAGGKGKVSNHRQRDERDEEKKTFPSLFGRSDVPRVVSSSSRKNHKKPNRRVGSGRGRGSDRKVYAVGSPRNSRKRHLNDKYDVEGAGLDLDLDSSRRTKRRDDQNKKNAPKLKGSQAGQVAQQRSEELENSGKEAWGQALAGLVSFGSQSKEVVVGDPKSQEDASSSKLSQDGNAQQRNLQTEESESGSDVKGKLSRVLPKFNLFGWRKDDEENTNDHSGSGGDDNTNGSPWPWQKSPDHDSQNSSIHEISLDDVSSYDEDHDNDGNSSHSSSSSSSGSYGFYPRHWGENESEDESSCESSLKSFSSSESSLGRCSV